MDTEKVIAELNQRFAQPLPTYDKRRVVFWLDEEQEYVDQLGDDFQLENARLVKLTGRNLFAVKKLLGQDDPLGNYVIYCPITYERPEDNWLMDVLLYNGEPYRTDRISQWMAEMRLADSPALRTAVKGYRKFFNAKDRRGKIAAMPPIQTHAQLHLAVMGAITGVKQPLQQPTTILKAVLAAGLNQAENELYQAIADYGAAEAFHRLVDNITGYHGADFRLQQAATQLLMTACSRTMQPESLTGLEEYISLPHQARCYDMVSDWLHADDKNTLGAIARQVEAELLLPDRFSHLPLPELLDTACFPCINEVILTRLMKDIGNEIIDLNAITQAVEMRRTCAWFSSLAIYYDGLLQVANMQGFFLAHSGGFHEALPERIWRQYTTDYYQMDTYYRQFHVAYGESLRAHQAEISDLFKRVADQVERLYVHWYMQALGDNWTAISEGDLRDLGYVRNIPRQVDFYQDYVAAPRRTATGRVERSRTFVLISDALRYEVASSLRDVLKQAQQARVQLDSMMAIFPTITKFGMAALLPHRALTLDEDRADAGKVMILADGVPTDSNDRDRILKAANPRSIALKYEDIIRLNKEEAREKIAGMEVIYIYHNRVDASSHSNEADVFTACDTAIQELHSLVKKITGDMNGTHILITADHGFLYTRDPLMETDKVSRASFTEDSVEHGRRYAILKAGAKPDYLMPVHMADVRTTAYAAYSPRGNIRIRMTGARMNFVHGGASLQEMVVPVITYQHLRNDSKEYQRNRPKYDTRPVTIRLLSAARQVSNLIFSLDFYQPEAVGPNWRAETYLLHFTDAHGRPISDSQKLIADKADGDNTARTWRVTFNLKQQHYDPHATYYLVIQDAGGQQTHREGFHIHIAFAIDAFDFFDA